MDQTYTTSCSPPVLNSPEVVESDFNWYEEVLKSEKEGELAMDDTASCSESNIRYRETSSFTPAPSASSTPDEVMVARPSFSEQIHLPSGARRSRQGKGSKLKQKLAFEAKKNRQRDENIQFTTSLHNNIRNAYGLPPPNPTSVECFNAILNAQVRKDEVNYPPPPDRGKSRKDLDAYLKLLKGSQNVLSEPLDMTTLYQDSDREDPNSVTSYFQPKRHTVVRQSRYIQ